MELENEAKNGCLEGKIAEINGKLYVQGESIGKVQELQKD